MNKPACCIALKGISRNLSRGVVAGLWLLSGCSWVGTGLEVGPTLGELQPAEIIADNVPLATVSLKEVEANYHRALELVEEPILRQKIMVRLAELAMERAEQQMLDATEIDSSGGRDHFEGAITLYEQLLEGEVTGTSISVDGQVSPTGDVLLYQLAKAHALDGKLEQSTDLLNNLSRQHPQSLFNAESEFRRAERAFSKQRYAAAQTGYGAVIKLGTHTPFYKNAVYMQGWSQFKQNRMRASLKSFTHVLDILAQDSPSLEGFDGAQLRLVQDTLRVMSLVFSDMNGADSISDTYVDLGPRVYEPLLYRELGKLYLEKQRYRDSADSYQHYVDHHPLSEFSPEFSVSVIEVYQLGDFPSLILPAKQRFVRQYGINSHYWAQKPSAAHELLKPHLKVYLRELAEYHHALAQTKHPLKKTLNNQTTTTLAGVSPSTRVHNEHLSLTAHYRLAAILYQEFIDTFPQDNDAPAIMFLMAEARFEATDYAEAYLVYSHVAYDTALAVDRQRGAEAGYSAVLAIERLLPLASNQTEIKLWQERKIDSALKFADIYVSDPRAPIVLSQTTQLLLNHGDYERAVSTAKRITQWQPQVEKKLRLNAWLMIAQIEFDREQFDLAEQAYQQALDLVAERDPQRASVIKRLAASVYRHAEHLATSDVSASVEQLLRVREIFPASAMAVSAQYDAINQLMAIEAWGRAEEEALDFQARYPSDTLTNSLTSKLVVIYEAQQNWVSAAEQLLSSYRSDKDFEVRRSSLYLAAEYYEKADDVHSAIKYYRDYAHRYSEPFAQVMEARFKMTTLYALTGDLEKRNFWLRKLIKGDNQAGPQRGQRSRYLGAFASAEVADSLYNVFVKIPLDLPLKKSLKKKNQALQKALGAYQGLAEYGVSEFTTLAGFRLAEIYAQLSRDLMNSQRPKNMDVEALEEYEVLLEEQAYPFEEQAIELHESNAQRSWLGVYDEWVKASFEALATLIPARYAKREQSLEFTNEIF